jgi:hypothetical protein
MRTNFYTVLCLITVINIFGQEKGIVGNENWIDNWTNFKPKLTDYRETNTLLVGEIKTNTTLTRKNVYLLSGDVIVKKNATLTIESGTIIRADFKNNSSLIVENGAKIIAVGTSTDPIVFTSNQVPADRKPVDWSGILLLGDAPTNKIGVQKNIDVDGQTQLIFGGKNIDNNAGILKYVRIEFAGKKINATKTTSAITFAAVGNKTITDFVQISNSQTDGVSVLGGNLNLNNIICYKNGDDDISASMGSQTNLNNGLLLKYPYFTDSNNARAIEISNAEEKGETDFAKKQTNFVATNLSIISFDDKAAGLSREAIFVDEYVDVKLSNSIINGFSPGIVLNHKIKTNENGLDKINLQNILFNFCKDSILFDATDYSDELKNHFFDNNPSNSKDYMDVSQVFNNPNIKNNPDFRALDNKTLTLK